MRYNQEFFLIEDADKLLFAATKPKSKFQNFQQILKDEGVDYV